MRRADGGPAQKAPNGLKIDDLLASQYVDFVAADEWEESSLSLDVTVSGKSVLDERDVTSVSCRLGDADPNPMTDPLLG